MTEGVIIKGVGGAYTVSTPQGQFTCNARGVFRKRGLTPLIGDWVSITITDPAERIGTLSEIKTRKNELLRPRVANVDQAIVTMAAAQPGFESGMLDRYLLLTEYAGIPAVICVNKSDLAADGQIEDICCVYERAGYRVILASATDGSGLDALSEAMRDKISVFAGPSGVGKSSLINLLSPKATQETGAISLRIDRGRHTTRHSEILHIEPSGLCVDTPGFSSLDISIIPPADFASLYREFTPFRGRCRFSNCRHITEADCAVKEQIGKAIHPKRYESYCRLYENSKSL